MTISDMVQRFLDAGLRVSEDGTKMFDSCFIPDKLRDKACILDMPGEDELCESNEVDLFGWNPVAVIEIDGKPFGIAQGYIRPCFLVWDRNPKAFEVYKAMVQ
jgi:hypothetical protein